MSIHSSRGGAFGRIRSFVLADHRYALLATSAVACVGMWLSSCPRARLSFLLPVWELEVAMYWLMAAWVAVSAAGLVSKLLHWRDYAQVSPLARPAARRALRIGSYLVWGCAAVVAADRLGAGLATAWQVAVSAPQRPDEPLTSILYMLWQGRDTFLAGIGTTVALAVLGTVIAFFLALALVFMRLQRPDRPDSDLVRFLKTFSSGFARLYSTVVRGTPMMVQAMIVYYGVFGIFRDAGMSATEVNAIWSTFAAGLVTVSLNSAAYMMEVLRGGIESVDRGQAEAARSLGLSQWQAMRRVVFPQGVRNAIPGLSNELVINIKDSSVLSVISVFDLMFATKTVAGIYYQQFQAALIAAVAYLVLTMVATALLGRMARRLDVRPSMLLSTSDNAVRIQED